MSARAVSVWFLDTDDPIAAVRSGLTNNVDAAQRLASSIYGEHVLVPVVETNLDAAMNSGDPHVYAGSFGPLSVVTCSLFATARPSTLTRTIASISPSPVATLLYTDPETATGTFARWEDGEVRRAFSATPVDIVEDLGLPFPFERPFWAGEHPLRYAPGAAPDPLALPFHPQQLAEQSNREWLGFRFTRPLADTDADPAHIPVTGFAIHPPDYEPTDADTDRYRASLRPSPTGTPGHYPTPGSPVTGGDRGGDSDRAVDGDTAPEPPKRGRLARYFGFGGKESDRN